MRLIIATTNKGKLKEIRHILRGVRLPMVCLADLKKKFNIKEDGQTFLENAIKKALPVSRMFPDDLVAGEDSGLQVEALAGEPGVRSRRFSGSSATDEKNNRKLLKILGGLPAKERKCRYQCWLVLFKNTRLLKICNGSLGGRIAYHAAGKNGFGYDPVFFLPQYKKTVAQLSLRKKNAVSHRARAFNHLRKACLPAGRELL